MKRIILNFSALSALVLLGAACGTGKPVPTEAAAGSQPADGVSVPVDDDSVEELPAIDLDEIRQAVVGLDLAAAEAWAAEQGRSVRVVEEDGESYAVTMDYVNGRINVVVVDGSITDVEGVG